MSFLDRAKQVAGQAATTAAKVGAEVGREAAKVGAEVGHQAATTIRDPATKARAQSALKKARHGFTTALERIDPKILADVVVKATSLQERANASLRTALWRLHRPGCRLVDATPTHVRVASGVSVDVRGLSASAHRAIRAALEELVEK